MKLSEVTFKDLKNTCLAKGTNKALITAGFHNHKCRECCLSKGCGDIHRYVHRRSKKPSGKGWALGYLKYKAFNLIPSYLKKELKFLYIMGGTEL